MCDCCGCGWCRFAQRTLWGCGRCEEQCRCVRACQPRSGPSVAARWCFRMAINRVFASRSPSISVAARHDRHGRRCSLEQPQRRLRSRSSSSATVGLFRFVSLRGFLKEEQHNVINRCVGGVSNLNQGNLRSKPQRSTQPFDLVGGSTRTFLRPIAQRVCAFAAPFVSHGGPPVRWGARTTRVARSRPVAVGFRTRPARRAYAGLVPVRVAVRSRQRRHCVAGDGWRSRNRRRTRTQRMSSSCRCVLPAVGSQCRQPRRASSPSGCKNAPSRATSARSRSISSAAWHGRHVPHGVKSSAAQ